MLISLLGVGLLLMGVGYNPTPIASGVKYTQNNTEKTEQPTIYKNNENSSTTLPNNAIPFEIHADQTVSTNPAKWYFEIAPDNTGLQNWVTKIKKTGYTNVGMINTWSYQANALAGGPQSNTTWPSNTNTYYISQYIINVDKTTYDRQSTFTYVAIQLTPYQEQFNTSIDFTINIFVNNLIIDRLDTGSATHYDVYTNPRLFSTTNEYYSKYDDLTNYVTSATIYQDIYNELNTPQANVYKTQSNGIVRYNADGTPYTTGDYKNNRYETLTISVVPNKPNWFFLFMKAVIVTPTQVTLPNGIYTNANLGYANNFYWHPEPYVSGYYIPGAINYEVIDIPGLMWEILSMPFAFISTAFNLTLFPNTPYAVNISNLVLMIFGILVVVFILSKVKSII